MLVIPSYCRTFIINLVPTSDRLAEPVCVLRCLVIRFNCQTHASQQPANWAESIHSLLRLITIDFIEQQHKWGCALGEIDLHLPQSFIINSPPAIQTPLLFSPHEQISILNRQRIQRIHSFGRPLIPINLDSILILFYPYYYLFHFKMVVIRKLIAVAVAFGISGAAGQ